MKKILLFLLAFSIWNSIKAQTWPHLELNGKTDNGTGEVVPNSDEAVIVKSATIDLPSGNNLVGIVWSNLSEEGYLYITDYAVSNMPNDPPLVPPSTQITLDPGYLIGHVDIAMIPYLPPLSPSTAHGAMVKIMYQRRLVNTDDWEIVVKTYTSISTSGIMNLTQQGPTLSLGAGKHVTIDPFVSINKSNPVFSSAYYRFFAIGWAEPKGYNLRVIDANDIVVDSNFIQYGGFPITLCKDDSVFPIELAAVTNFHSGGVVVDDAVYITCRKDNMSGGSATLDIWKWDIDFDFTTVGNLTHLQTMNHGPFFGLRPKIEAMSVQDLNANEPLYNAMVCIDASYQSLYTTQSGISYYYGPPADLNCSPPSGTIHTMHPSEAFDITAGIGSIGNQNYVANRHYPILEETTYNDFLLTYGVERGSPTTSYQKSTFAYQANDLLDEIFINFATFAPRIINHNNTYITGGDHAYYNTKWLYNISNSTSTNSGRSILNTYTHKYFPDPTYKIYYKIKISEEDLNDPVPVPGVSNHWSTKSNTIESNLLLEIFPNPSKDYLIVQHPNTAIVNIQIFGIDGRNLTIPIDKSDYEAYINTSKLLSGTYILQTTLIDGSIIKKPFIKE